MIYDRNHARIVIIENYQVIIFFRIFIFLNPAVYRNYILIKYLYHSEHKKLLSVSRWSIKSKKKQFATESQITDSGNKAELVTK